MRIAVCVKQVPDTATRIRVAPNNLSIDETGVQFVLCPYDEYAVEEALKIRSAAGSGEVVLFCVGPPRATEALRTALAMGADRAVHLTELAGLDWVGTARALAAMIHAEGNFDLILTGRQTTDDDCFELGPALAELLGLPDATIVIKLEVGPLKVTAHRDIEGGRAIVELPLPAVITCTKGLNQPRYPSLPGIMKAKQKPIKVVTQGALGLTPQPQVALLELALPPPRQSGKLIKADAEQAAQELMNLLHHEAKVV
ncbi:MAG: electron transfer flavoprotein subunit beta/FixA family protein [Deinococcus sp.]|nr:electron transfer flavoprotein subunit beta/FixA family protein [Deinococcus sp.]